MKFLLNIIALSFVITAYGQQRVEMVSTTEHEAWVSNSNSKVSDAKASPDIKIEKQNSAQTIDGFGGCFNELGWTSLNALRETDRKSIMEELFSPGKGANFTICRMPIGANDFSLDWYSYDETPGDFNLTHFSIANDMNTLVPFIKEAKHYNPGLKIWASPWSPPSWMKYNKHYAGTSSSSFSEMFEKMMQNRKDAPMQSKPAVQDRFNIKMDKQYQNNLPRDREGKEGTDMFIQQDKYLKAYALYFSKFIGAYKKEGIDIFAVMPQNEFNSAQVFPSCCWTAKGLANFIGRYLGPSMKKKGVKIFFGTMERAKEALVDTILTDPYSSKYVQGIGFQWAGKGAIAGIHKRYPGMKLYQSEQECGDGNNDWEYCKYAWTLMKHYISNGASAYMYWNIALEEEGISRWGWCQNSLVTVNKKKKTYQYNHEYYLLKHVSHFVQTGAKVLKCSGAFSNVLAFENPDKSIVMVLQNDTPSDKNISVNVDNKNITTLLKADSFNTIIFK